MFRYRCPRCSVVLQAPEIRAGKTTVCSKCSQPLTIPADKRHWLNEKGEPLLASPTMVIPSPGITPPPLLRWAAVADFELPAEPDNDVLGAIAHGDIAAENDPPEPLAPPGPSEPIAPKPEAQPQFSRSLPAPEPDDGRVELYPPAPLGETPRPPVTPSPPPTKNPTPPPRAVPRPAWAEASNQSDSRSRRVVNGTAAESERGGALALEEPLRLRTEMDIAADLTSALATRMKPPPKPPRDLKPSTAIWILTTGLALALLAASLISSNHFIEAVLAIGAAQAIAGYAWVTSLAFRRDPRRGIVCALPPFTFWYLTNWKYAKHRPLRFVLSGAALLGLALLAPSVQSQTRRWAGVTDAQPPIAAPLEIEKQSRLAQLRHYREQRRYDSLIALLRTLARTDSMYSDDAKNRVEISAEVKELCTKHTDSGVKIEALAAYATWGGPDARELCLEASRSLNREERLMALRLLPRWKDETVARRIAEMIKGRGNSESAAASDALITIGGPIAEAATIPLLRMPEQDVRLEAMEILGNEKVGGAVAVAELKEVARTSPDPGTRQRAEAKAQQIQERLNK